MQRAIKPAHEQGADFRARRFLVLIGKKRDRLFYGIAQIACFRIIAALHGVRQKSDGIIPLWRQHFRYVKREIFGFDKRFRIVKVARQQKIIAHGNRRRIAHNKIVGDFFFGGDKRLEIARRKGVGARAEAVFR